MATKKPIKSSRPRSARRANPKKQKRPVAKAAGKKRAVRKVRASAKKSPPRRAAKAKSSAATSALQKLVAEARVLGRKIAKAV